MDRSTLDRLLANEPRDRRTTKRSAVVVPAPAEKPATDTVKALADAADADAVITRASSTANVPRPRRGRVQMAKITKPPPTTKR